jgi:2',3'-cyclic-nucleotide 2'-phosphodiesterase (5'-nucleotidase family)
MEASFEELSICSKVLFLQLNDVSHIDFTYDYSKSYSLILPRIATIQKRLRKLYPNNMFFCFPGDFLAPSCLSKEFKGKHMVSILNKMGVTFVTFGNHEFEKELTENELYARIKESNFKWISTNICFRNEKRFGNLYKEKRLSYFECIKLSPNLRVIVFGITEDQSRYPNFVTVFNPIEESLHYIDLFKNELKKEAKGKNIIPMFVAISHQPLKKDRALAKKCSDILLIMGGHDHNIEEEVKETHCLITKTASNARTLRFNWIITISAAQIAPLIKCGDQEFISRVAKHAYAQIVLPAMYQMFFEKNKPADEDEKKEWLEILLPVFFELIPGKRFSIIIKRLGEETVILFSLGIKTMHPIFIEMLPEDEEITKVIKHWLNKSRVSSSQIIVAPEDLILEDQIIRRKSTNFCNFVADIVRGLPLLPFDLKREKADIALINSGVFRIDRNLKKGEPISDKTLCDIFYYQNSIKLYHLTGKELLKLLQKANELRKSSSKEGHGDFLQLSGLEVEVEDDIISKVNQVGAFGQKEVLDPRRKYSVATLDYIAKSSEYKEFFVNKQSKTLDNDLRKMVKVVLKNLRTAQIYKFPEFDILIANCDKPRWIFSERCT